MSATSADRAAPRSPGELFFVFSQLALQGFGGVLPIARHMLVERYRWLSIDEFTDILARCHALPGPNIINVSICIGSRHFGALGALAACSGLIAAPFVLVLLLGVFYQSFADVPAIAAALRGSAAIGAGLMIATALRMSVSPRLRSWRTVFGLLAFAAVSWLRLPLALVLGVLVPFALAAAWLEGNR